jgi:hypothetical protein
LGEGEYKLNHSTPQLSRDPLGCTLMDAHMKSRLLLASTVILGITVSNSQSLRDYVGSYVVPREQRHNSPYLYQFDIIEDTSRANVFYANVMFFSDTTVDSTDSALDCITRELVLIGDSLKFKTNDCFNERYEFIGKFIRKPR